MAGEPILISDLRGGRNGVDPPTDPKFPDNQCVEALNVDFSIGPVGGARGGSDNVSVAGGATAFSLGIRALCRHVPSGEEGEAELWGTDGAGVIKRLRNGTVWDNVALDDAITGEYDKTVGVSFNGKLFLFYKSVVNRLHVYDPILNVVRRVGINPGTGLPTVAGQGVGTLSGARYYRVRFLQMNGTICVRRSEPTPASALFTPGGANQYARVTLPALPGERETHWEVEIALATTGPWYIAAGLDSVATGTQTVITTLFYDDATTTAGITALATSHPAGMYTLFPAMRMGITDNNRLIGAGSFLPASEPAESRIWLSPVLGSDDRGDDERWNNQTTLKHRIDTSEKNGGSITSMIGPVQGVFWTLKYRQVWRHVPTSDVTTPYLTRQISHVVGSVSHAASLLAEDEAGSPAGYFLSHRGYYRVGVDGFMYMGRDVEDVWKGRNGYSKVNLSASIVAHATFHTDESDIYLWFAAGISDTPNVRLRCNLKQATRRDRYGLRGGWVVDSGDGASAYCSCLFANTLGASMSKDLKPYIGRSNTTIYKCDTSAMTDNGTAYQSYIKTKSIVPPQLMKSLFQVTESVVTAVASANSLRQTLIGDFGVNEKPSLVALDAKRVETVVVRKFGASMQSEQGAIQVQLGDIQAVASNWVVYSLVIPAARQDDR